MNMDSVLDNIVHQAERVFLLLGCVAAIFLLLRYMVREMLSIVQFGPIPPVTQQMGDDSLVPETTTTQKGTLKRQNAFILDTTATNDLGNPVEDQLLDEESSSNEKDERKDEEEKNKVAHIPLSQQKVDLFRRETWTRDRIQTVVSFVIGFIMLLWLILTAISPNNAGRLRTPASSADFKSVSPLDALGARHLHDGDIAYYTPMEWTTRKGVQIPMLTCAYHNQIALVHERILGKSSFRVNIESVRQLLLEGGDETGASELAYLRQRVEDYCLLEDASLVTMPLPPHTLRNLPVPWKVPNAEQFGKRWASRNVDGTVRNLVLGELEGDNYYVNLLMVHSSSMSAVPSSSSTATGTSYGLQPLMVALPELITSASVWYDDMLDESRVEMLKEDTDCLCGEHLGIVGSGFYFVHVGSAWILMLHPRITTVLSVNMDNTTIMYNKRLQFPWHINSAYGLHPANATYQHWHRVEVTYLDLSALFQSGAAGFSEITEVLPMWNSSVVWELIQSEEERLRAFPGQTMDVTRFLVFPFRRIRFHDSMDPETKKFKKQSVTIRTMTLTGSSIGCLYHCERMSMIARQQLKLPDPPVELCLDPSQQDRNKKNAMDDDDDDIGATGSSPLFQSKQQHIFLVDTGKRGDPSQKHQHPQQQHDP